MINMKFKSTVFNRISLILFISSFLLILSSCENGDGSLKVSGSVEVKEIKVSSEIPGKVTKINFKEGDMVKAGDILLKVDSNQYQIQLNALKIKKLQLETLLKQSADDLKKAKNLYSGDSIAKDTLEKAELSHKINQLKLEEINENIKLVELGIEKSTIKSPVTGLVHDRYVEGGEVVGAGKPLFQIYNYKDTYIKSYIPETFLSEIKPGDEVELVIDSKPEEKYKARIFYISQEAEFTPTTLQTSEEKLSQVFEIRLEVPENGGLFKPGLFVTITIPRKP